MSTSTTARTLVRAAGEVLITAGVVLLLLCVYELVWTNVGADRHAAELRAQIDTSFDSTPSIPAGAVPTMPSALPGKGFALMYIPRLRDRVWGAPVVQGVTSDDLRGAVGHYPDTQFPGEVGNFAVAAHRATNGELFRDIDQLRTGDRVYVETATSWFEYTLVDDEIVPPHRTSVLLPVPNRPGQVPTKALLALTTCNPRWASYERWIWYGELVRATPRSSGAPVAVRGT